jgi:hypothetical protein
MRKGGILAVSAIFMTTVAAAGPRSGSYRIELSNGSQVIAVDAPVKRGTVVTFHNAGGALTGVPSEMIVRVEAVGRRGAASASRQRPVLGTTPPDVTVARPPAGGLQPGEVLVIGPTGDGATLGNASGGAMAAGGSGSNGGGANANGVGAYGVNGYGGNVNPNVLNPNLPITNGGGTGTAINPNTGTMIGADGLPRVASSTDLSRAQAAQTTVGPNGFPATNNGATTVIGPNGTPTLAPGIPGSAAATATGQQGSAQPVIGPNGTPVLAPQGQPGSVQPGQAGSAQPVIGPNGTPVLAPQGQPGSVQPGQPGSAQPVIGPNGTPVLAPQGRPGSTAPNTSPNGTPNGAPSGNAPSGNAPSGNAPSGSSSSGPGSH